MQFPEWISRFEVSSRRWLNTSYLRPDGKEEFRELKKYGNRHAVFERGAQYGILHYDKYNATDFPIGTILHGANYVEEKTDVPKEVVIGTGIATAILGAIYLYKRSK